MTKMTMRKAKGKVKAPKAKATAKGKARLDSTRTATPVAMVEVKNPNDVAENDLTELLDELKATGLAVRTLQRQQVGYGVTWWEVVLIYMGTKIAEAAEDVLKEHVKTLMSVGVKRAKKRFKKKGNNRPTYIGIFGPDGKVIKSVKISDSKGKPEDRTEEDRANEKYIVRKPPADLE